MEVGHTPTRPFSFLTVGAAMYSTAYTVERRPLHHINNNNNVVLTRCLSAIKAQRLPTVKQETYVHT